MITLEQARALDAIARHGSLSQAARVLHKVHSALLYTMKSLEDQTGLQVFDRSGYRTKLTPAGERLWRECQNLLDAEKRLEVLAYSLRSGWEPLIKIISDGVLPPEPLLGAVQKLSKEKSPCRVSLYSEYLSGVEEVFERENATMMLTVLPVRNATLTVEKLPGIRSVLVVHRDHPVAAKAKKKWKLEELTEFSILTVHGSDLRLQFGTGELEAGSLFSLSDFSAKKKALLQGMGFGWVPEYLIADELESGVLVPVQWEGKTAQTIQPWLAHRGEKTLGKAGRFFLNEIRKFKWS